jgi:hypothetical protein
VSAGEQRLDDQRKTMREIIACTAVEPHALRLLAGNDAEALMLDFVIAGIARLSRYSKW